MHPHPHIDAVRVTVVQSFFPEFILLYYIESPNPENPRRPDTRGPKPHQLITPILTAQSKTPKPKPPKHRKCIKNNPGKNIVLMYMYMYLKAPISQTES